MDFLPGISALGNGQHGDVLSFADRPAVRLPIPQGPWRDAQSTKPTKKSDERYYSRSSL
jgi:hypothetical protein